MQIINFFIYTSPDLYKISPNDLKVSEVPNVERDFGRVPTIRSQIRFVICCYASLRISRALCSSFHERTDSQESLVLNDFFEFSF